MISEEQGILEESKKFTWSLEKFTQNKLEIKIHFENPENISQTSLDYVKLTFTLTSYYLIPFDERYYPVPNGYTMISPLPPQISEEAVVIQVEE